MHSEVTTNLPNPSWRKLLAAIFSVGACLGSGITYGVFQAIDGHKPPTFGCATGEPVNVFRVDYERLELGMSQAVVEAMLNPGVEISLTESTAQLLWENCDGSKLQVTFRNDALIHKEQADLQ